MVSNHTYLLLQRPTRNVLPKLHTFKVNAFNAFVRLGNRIFQGRSCGGGGDDTAAGGLESVVGKGCTSMEENDIYSRQ